MEFLTGFLSGDFKKLQIFLHINILRDRDNTDNKFSKYTIVSILYCSGDVFVGNVTRPYNDKAGVPVQQHVCVLFVKSEK